MMRAAVARFFTEYDAAFDDDFNLTNKAYDAFVDAHGYLRGFTLDDQGLTPEQAKELLQLLDHYENAQGDADSAQVPKADAVRRLDLAFRRPYA